LFPSIAATDFFSVEVITRSGLARYFVLFVIDHKTRKSSGIKTVKLPARSPNLNAYAERFVRSIKSECLAQIIPLGERHLRHAVKEYTEHYHVERNHQGLGNRLIEKPQGVVDMNCAVVRHEGLGGVLNYYERRAA
jgi:transposase InsO family protein